MTIAHRRVSFAASAAAAALLFTAYAAGTARPEPDAWWHTDYATAVAKAKESGAPILVVFR